MHRFAYWRRSDSGRPRLSADWHWPTANGLLLIPALYVTIAVHELGHALAGKLVGFDTGGIAIGGFVVLKSGKNWVVQFNWGCMKEIMSASSASNLYVVSQLLAFYYRLDQHADEAALEHLENLLASSGTSP